MTFDQTYRPSRDNLSPSIAALMDRVFYSRRANGFNVQFMNDGHLDEWSLVDAAQRDRFIAKLARDGIDHATSAVSA